MMRSTILIRLAPMLAAGCNYSKETDPPPPVDVPATYTQGSEVPPPPEAKA